MMKFSGHNILAIGDAHITKTGPGSDLIRISALSKVIYDTKPDTIVIIGDWGDFPSLAAHLGSKAVGGGGSTRAHSGKTLEDDLQAFEQSLAALDLATDLANERHIRSRRRDRLYKPRKIFCGGNHEHRLEKVPQHIPELNKLIGSHIIKEIVEDRGWEWVPFLETISVQGILFSHYFESGTMGRAVGINQALNKLSESCVWGHSHTFGYDTRTTASGRRINAVCLPTFKAHRATTKHEESGVVFLNNAKNGDFEISRVSERSLTEGFRKRLLIQA